MGVAAAAWSVVLVIPIAAAIATVAGWSVLHTIGLTLATVSVGAVLVTAWGIARACFSNPIRRS